MFPDSNHKARLARAALSSLLWLGVAVASVWAAQLFHVTPDLAAPTPPSCTITKSGNSVSVSVPSSSGGSYQLQRSSTLTPAGFMDLGNAQSGTGSVLTFTDPNAPLGRAFYRINIDAGPGCLSVTGSITQNDVTFQRPNSFAQGGTCSTSTTGSAVHYDAYEFTTSSAKTVQASLCASQGGSANYDSFVAIYQAANGAAIAGFTPDGCSLAKSANDDACSSASQTQANLVAGTFYIVVTQYATSTSLCTGGLCYGDYTLSVRGLEGCPLVTPTPTPTPTPTMGCVTFAGSIATSDPTFQRPNTFAQGGSCSTSSVGAAVHYDVYQVTTASARTVQASLCAAAGGSADYDSVVAIYQSATGAVIPGFVPNGCSLALAVNDDFCSSASQVQANVIAGTFYIVVTQYSTSSANCTGGLCYGNYSLSLRGLEGCPLSAAIESGALGKAAEE